MLCFEKRTQGAAIVADPYYFLVGLLEREALVALELHGWDGRDEGGACGRSIFDGVVGDDLVDVGRVGEAGGDGHAGEEGVVDAKRELARLQTRFGLTFPRVEAAFLDCGTEGVVEYVVSAVQPYLRLDEQPELRVSLLVGYGGLDLVAVRLECDRAVVVIFRGSLPRRAREGVRSGLARGYVQAVFEDVCEDELHGVVHLGWHFLVL